MTEETSQNSFFKRFGLICLKSPINTLFGIALSGILFYIYVLGNGEFFYKMVLVGIVLLWLLWCVAKYVLTLLLILGLLGVGAYFYYDYTHKEINKCEEAGGYWNKQTKKCEKKAPTFMEQMESKFNEYRAKFELWNKVTK